MTTTADEATLLAVAQQVLADNPYGFLITTPQSGATRARLVRHLGFDLDEGIWIGTSPQSRKVEDVWSSSSVVYAVEDRDRFAYVSLSGTASVVSDDETRVAKWSPPLLRFFPDGPSSESFVLLRVRVDRLELMSFADGIHPAPFGLMPAVVDRPVSPGDPAAGLAGT